MKCCLKIEEEEYWCDGAEISTGYCESVKYQ